MQPWPLAVDLDGSLIEGDVSAAAAMIWARKAPIAFAREAGLALLDRAAYKRRLALAVGPPPVRVRTPFLAWLTEQKAMGRPLHLMTGADQTVAEAVCGPLGLFQSIEGSDGRVNLVGAAKAIRLQQRFPVGFSYAGDSRQDLAVFAVARSIVLVAPKPGVAAAAMALGRPIEARF